MAENKTVATKASVAGYLKKLTAQQRADSKILIEMMQDITDCKPEMWGSSIVGFDTYHYKYDSGREGDFLMIGFSARKQTMTIYIVPGFAEYKELMAKLGKFKTSVSCLYVKTLSDIDLAVLKSLMKKSVANMRKKYKTQKSD